MSRPDGTDPIRVVLADDQELVRSGFVSILQAQPDIDVVAEAADGRAAVDAVLAHRPHVVLLDVRMPHMDGIEAATIICGQTASRVIVLTTFDQEDYVYDALYAGASGFLTKDVRRDDLVHAVRVVAAGESLLSPAVTRRLISDLTRHRPRTTRRPAPELASLTSREQETLGLLGLGMSNAEIAVAMTVSAHTVKTHVSSVLGKLGLRDRVQAVIAAYESGMVVAPDPPS